MNRIINILSTCLVQAKAIGADAEGRQAYGSFAFLFAGSKRKGCPGLPKKVFFGQLRCGQTDAEAAAHGLPAGIVEA